MKKFIKENWKNLILEIVIFLVILCFVDEMSIGPVYMKIIVSLLLFWLGEVIFVQRGRINRIENYLNILSEGAKAVPEMRAVSYQVSVSVEPNWIKIIRWCFPEFKSDDEAWEFTESLYKDKELKLDKEAGLFQKSFSFVEFYDSVSGLNPVWSKYNKGFLGGKKWQVRGHVFEDFCFGIKGDGGMRDKFPNNQIWKDMIISPSFIGFYAPDEIMPGILDGDIDIISQFPYKSIKEFFVDVRRNCNGFFSDSGPVVKTFPKRIHEYLDESGFKYDPYCGCGEINKELVESKWLKNNGIELYNQGAWSYDFKGPLYDVALSFTFFRPYDR